MESCVKRSVMIMALCCLSLIFNNSLSDQSVLPYSFDSLFPKTWYEKGCIAIVSVWHLFKERAGQDLLDENTIDTIVGRLAFGSFCIKKTVQEKQLVYLGDMLYLKAMLVDLKNIVSYQQLSDHIVCCIAIIDSIILTCS